MKFDTPPPRPGSTPKGAEMMDRFCVALEAGRIPDNETLVYFLKAFREIKSGAPPKKALELERSRGRKEPYSAIECGPRIEIAGAVVDCMTGGMSYERSVVCVAEKYRISGKTVQRHYATYRDFVREARKINKAFLDIAKTIEQGKKAFLEDGILKDTFRLNKQGEVVYKGNVGGLPLRIIIEHIKQDLAALPKK